ncbi:glycosyltransferase family 20-domain-containing protein [Sphaerosporella brunnea]|uniref:Glycosyltransferase family 20-domain-containing protein n=1 Tax=Sphaerosporella brunnea TaxID=1250544 RepID=A0A5J5EWC8_9PEZI|nr:glycosyltransferase family 20-domain-containing protein [Sphaerosporella brunnea]
MTSERPGRRRSSTSASSGYSSDYEEENWTIEKTDFGNGGLKNAVEAATDISEKVYVGTLGYGTDGLDESKKVAIEGRLREDYHCLVAFTSDADFDGHYNHYCKEVLWPVFHYLIPDHPKSKAFLDHSWKYFESLNRSVADVIIKDYKKGDTVWVNDYHLLLIPKMVRDALGPDAKIGFFLHVGFPSSEIFRCLAHREKLLEGILGATMVGFQNEEYARHFLQTCSRLLNVEVKNDGVLLDTRFVNVISLPIGIDPAQLDEKRKEPEVATWTEQLKQRYAGKKLFVARDKLDGVRGVKQKLLAFELFLKKNPEYIGKVVLIQVALTTSSIVESQSTVSDIVTRINCSFSTLDYQPVVYLHQDITYHQYIALLQIADALVVTSLRDGMNLTSHEFVYLQDKNYAPLILSEFTGSASLFGGAEISVNPWDHSMCAVALLQALTMSEEEKKQRWEKLHAAVIGHTAAHWFYEFLKRLKGAWEEQQRRGSAQIPRLSAKVLAEKYQNSHKRVFFLQYEGTLVSWGSGTVVTSPQRILDTINDLLEDPTNVVYIMSSRPPHNLEQIFLRVPGVGLFAEGGCFMRPFGSPEWTRLGDEDLPWKSSVKEILDYFVERTPGTWLEERTCSYIWHLEKAEDPTAASRQAGDCCNHVNDACENFDIHAIPITGGGVLVESKKWNKVNACRKVIEHTKARNWQVDFVMVAGNGRDDEEVFEWAQKFADEERIPNVTTARVGHGHTSANATTTGVAGEPFLHFDRTTMLTRIRCRHCVTETCDNLGC